MSSALSGCRVLVVEDEVIVSWLLEEMLIELGCTTVGPAARVKQALAMLETQPIDMAVLDVNLNGEKSFPVADALIGSGVPFAFSTGYHKDGLPDLYKKFPMLQKPYDTAALAAVLSKLLMLGKRSTK